MFNFLRFKDIVLKKAYVSEIEYAMVSNSPEKGGGITYKCRLLILI